MQKEALDVHVSLDREKEQVRRELLGRLRELETLPDRLRKTEQQLREAQQEADARDRRNMENNSALSEVRHKVEVSFRPKRPSLLKNLERLTSLMNIIHAECPREPVMADMFH